MRELMILDCCVDEKLELCGVGKTTLELFLFSYRQPLFKDLSHLINAFNYAVWFMCPYQWASSFNLRNWNVLIGDFSAIISDFWHCSNKVTLRQAWWFREKKTFLKKSQVWCVYKMSPVSDLNFCTNNWFCFARTSYLCSWSMKLIWASRSGLAVTITAFISHSFSD